MPKKPKLLNNLSRSGQEDRRPAGGAAQLPCHRECRGGLSQRKGGGGWPSLRSVQNGEDACRSVANLPMYVEHRAACLFLACCVSRVVCCVSSVLRVACCCEYCCVAWWCVLCCGRAALYPGSARAGPPRRPPEPSNINGAFCCPSSQPLTLLNSGFCRVASAVRPAQKQQTAGGGDRTWLTQNPCQKWSSCGPPRLDTKIHPPRPHRTPSSAWGTGEQNEYHMMRGEGPAAIRRRWAAAPPSAARIVRGTWRRLAGVMHLVYPGGGILGGPAKHLPTWSSAKAPQER
eukprot:gene21960-biopygen10210